MTIKTTILASVVAVSASAAAAEGLYVGGSVGGSSLGGIYITEVENHRAARRSEDKLTFGNMSVTAYIGTSGLSVSERTSIGVELSYTHSESGENILKVDNGYNFGRLDITRSIDAKLMFFCNPNDKWTLFTGAGLSLGNASQGYSFVTGEVYSGKQNYNVAGTVLSIGAEYFITNNWSLRGEITHRKYGGGSGDNLMTWGGVNSTFSSSSLSSTSVSVGLTMKF